MQIDDTAYQHDDLDTDSLFGSPPPSPGRGRSPPPVPLALPSGRDISQNVGTLALPGSHLFSELPPVLPPAPPVAAVSRRPQAQVRQPPVNRSTSVVQSAKPRPASSRKKRVSARSTPAVESPPIQMPSPDEPLPLNFLRNQDALLGRAGLVAGVRPADLAFQRHTRGQSSSNPIIVEEEAEQPLIGRRPLVNRLPAHAHSTNATPPSYEEIIQALVKQKNLVPVLHALLRVVTGSAQLSQYPPSQTVPATFLAPSASPTGQENPSYPSLYAYPYSYYCPSPQSPGSSTSRYPSTNAHISRAPKRRRLSSVPAGAGDWDVPYPFAEGQGPPNYRTNWEKERGKQLIEDLIGLVKSAARKAAVKKVVQETKKGEATQEQVHASEGYPIGSVEYYRERVLSHYRPQTRTYGYESGCFPYAHWARSYTPSSLSSTSSTSSTRARAATTDALSSPLATHAATSVVTSSVTTASAVQPPPNDTASNAAQHAVTVESVTVPSLASQQSSLCFEERSQSEPPLPSTSHAPLISPPAGVSQDNPQANLDDFLTFINNLPSGDLDALFSADFSHIPNVGSDSSTNLESSASQTPSSAQSTDISPLFDLDSSSFAIDPALLALSEFQDPARDGGNMEPVNAIGEGHVQSLAQSESDAISAAPPTPTLIGSPLSLSDLDPATPHWDFSFPEPEIVGAVLNGGSSDAGPSGVTEGIVHDQSESENGSKKGKGRATEADMMNVDTPTQMHHIWPPAEPLTPTTWRSEPTTASASVATSRQSTPGPSASVPPFILAPTVGPPQAATQLSAFTSLPASSAPGPRTPYAHHIPPFLNIPPHGVAGSRFSRPATSIRSKNLDREDVLNRARAMRAQIVGEIERAKVELWETTMEGGCLVTLSKELDKISGLQSDTARASSVSTT